ncbi:MAG: hypothetical protein K1X78_26745 [Verrucomicrobiaceae bacterium]|nr:hypothetical protein [Verrucomicrobiaceae bacterium]
MKPPSLCLPPLKLILCVLLAAAGCGAARAQQPAYASTYYPAPQPSFGDRIRSAGQSVGDFVRRKFYGEPSPTAYPQQPVYRTPSGGTTAVSRRQRYNLDAPAHGEPAGPLSTGYLTPDRKSVPKYTAPPRTVAPAPVKKDEDQPSAKPKSKTSARTNPPRTAASSSSSKKRASDPEPVSRKKYSPAKPSSFGSSKETSKHNSVRKRVEEDPPEPPRFEAPPEPKTEEKLNTSIDGPADSSTVASSSGGIAPTIGGTDFNLGSASSFAGEERPESASSRKSSKTSANAGSASGTGGDQPSGSFLVGKKTAKTGRVISPYAPFNELDITGLPSGSLALDPTTQKVFQVP